MKIHVFQGGRVNEDGCTFYRTYAPGHALAAQGADVTVSSDIPDVIWQDTHTLDGTKIPRVRGWNNPENADVVVFQRPLQRDIADLIELIADQVTVVVDMDDDFFQIPKANAAWKYFQPQNSPLRNTDHLKRALAACHVITVTTPALARRYGKKSVVVPNFVPESYLGMAYKHREHKLRVGWTGTMQTHPHDLESTRGGVGRGVLAAGADFHVVGDGVGVRDALQLSSLTTLTSSGWKPRDEYMHAMTQIDVGVVPLHSSAFNHGKSWLKGIEFASIGIPFVASNTQPYVQLHKEYGLGIIARSPAEWASAVEKLATDASMREDLSARGLEIVTEKLTLEKNAYRWLDAWTSRVPATV